MAGRPRSRTIARRPRIAVSRGFGGVSGVHRVGSGRLYQAVLGRLPNSRNYFGIAIVIRCE